MTESRPETQPSEERFKLFFDAAFEGIGITEGGVLIDMNDRLAEMLGYGRDELIGRSFMEMVVPEDRALVEEMAREGRTDPYTHRAWRKDGSVIRIEVRGRQMEVEGRTVRVAAIRDLTEQEEVLARIRDSEERLRFLFDASPDAYLVQDLDGRILESNHAAERLLGFAREEMAGRTFRELGVLPGDLHGAALLWGQRLRDGQPVGPGQLPLNGKDGRRIWVESQSTPVRIMGEDLVLTVARDISAQREVSDQLSLVTKAVESSSEVVFLTDSQGVFTFVNPAFTRLYGWEASEVVEKATPRVIKSGLYGEDFYEGMWKTLLGGKVFEGELRNRTRSGKVVDIAASVNPVMNDDDDVIGFLAIQSDISSRKRHEETLLTIARGVSGSTGETFFRDLAHHLCLAVGADVAIIGALDGEEGDRIRTVAVEVDGKPQDNFTYTLAESPCQRALDEGICVEPWRSQERFPEGSGFIGLGAEAYVGKALRDASGEPLGIAIVLFREPLVDPTLPVSMLEIFAARAAVEMERSRAETHRRRLEEQLRQAQKMEEIGQLTGGIAHDFQNLLSVILLNTELIKDTVSSGELPALAEVSEVEEAAQQAANMTRKLLGFGRRADLSLLPTELGAVVEGMSSMLRRVIPENIHVSIRVADKLGKVKADPGAVEQILLNLATNARDAMPGGGSLVVELAKCTVEEEAAAEMPGGREGTFLCLSVADTGVGMDEVVVARVFEPFFTTKPVGEGTGLGLAMVYGLAQQHGGFVQVQSEVGVGTTVSLFLPLLEQPAEETSGEEALPAARGGSEKLLVVEDQAALRRTLKLVLERAGYEVILAEDGQDGLELARSLGPEIDLIISDLVMPRLGGGELYRTLRDVGDRTPFIMASGYAGRSASGLADLDPSVPVLKKPWKPGQLLLLVREVLDRP